MSKLFHIVNQNHCILCIWVYFGILNRNSSVLLFAFVTGLIYWCPRTKTQEYCFTTNPTIAKNNQINESIKSPINKILSDRSVTRSHRLTSSDHRHQSSGAGALLVEDQILRLPKRRVKSDQANTAHRPAEPGDPSLQPRRLLRLQARRLPPLPRNRPYCYSKPGSGGFADQVPPDAQNERQFPVVIAGRRSDRVQPRPHGGKGRPQDHEIRRLKALDSRQRLDFILQRLGFLRRTIVSASPIASPILTQSPSRSSTLAPRTTVSPLKKVPLDDSRFWRSHFPFSDWIEMCFLR